MALQAPETALEAPPRVGPVPGSTSRFHEALRAAQELQLDLFPWQRYALQVMMETVDGKWKYSEFAAIAPRRNGKTKLLLPRIKMGLDRGEHFIHTAQNRLLPRKVLLELMNRMPDAKVRTANGQEEIISKAGGRYIITAPQRGARGEDADVLIVDELREMEDFDFMAAAEPVLASSDNSQVIYLSNAGTEKSVVLNDLIARAETDPNLAYLEWSADPDLNAADEATWWAANPGMRYGKPSLDYLRKKYLKYSQAGQLSIFETEHLSRQVKTMATALVSPVHWQQVRGKVEWPPIRPVLGISVDPEGKRASAAAAWKQTDGKIAVTIVGDVDGDPVDTTAFGVALQGKVTELGISEIAFDPWTDKYLAAHFLGAQPINGSDFANASERFVRSVETQGLVHQWSDRLSDELPHASRRATTGNSFQADRAGARSITTVLAAIRAVWLASNPTQVVGDFY